MKTPPRQTHWQGPFRWPNFESALPPAPSLPGTYLQAFEYQDGYLIYAAGITRRTVHLRLQEHTTQYLAGIFSLSPVPRSLESGKNDVFTSIGNWVPCIIAP